MLQIIAKTLSALAGFARLTPWPEALLLDPAGNQA